MQIEYIYNTVNIQETGGLAKDCSNSKALAI